MLLKFKSVEQIKQKNTSYSKGIYKQVKCDTDHVDLVILNLIQGLAVSKKHKLHGIDSETSSE